MTESRTQPAPGSLTHLVEQYLGLESMEIMESLLDVCGARIDARAMPLLTRRLQEEEAQILSLQIRGYTRMREKSEQLVASLKPLITALKQAEQDARRDNT
jgi:hypothetical protein